MVIEDATTAALLASAIAHGPVTITDGTYSISANGSYTMSFTAGSFAYSDTGTFTPDGSGIPGSGTWTLAPSDGSTGTLTNTWDAVNKVYNSTIEKQMIPEKPNPYYPMYPYPKVNDIEGTDKLYPDGTSTDLVRYTFNGNPASPFFPTKDKWSKLPPAPSGSWVQELGGPASGSLTGLWTGGGSAGTFGGTVNAIPEPTSAILVGIGAVAVIAVTTIQQRRAKESRVVVGQSGPSE
jgi:hypothetical protein